MLTRTALTRTPSVELPTTAQIPLARTLLARRARVRVLPAVWVVVIVVVTSVVCGRRGWWWGRFVRWPKSWR
ncbi:hypothetical protein OHB01_34685 [Microbispora hainanensis]|uniref:Uncharacterized protein n=1 Tax=Microbispora hainanensis TaxID=568844 RepID=A0ABZ1SYW8_9ACTN|nr:hypothetical protein [Microbispora hainanensis]